MYSARHCRLGRVSHVYDVLGPTLSTWSLTYTMYSARHCRLGLSRTRCTRPDTVNLVSHVHDVLGPTLSTWARLPRIRCTRPDTVNLVSHVHDVLGPTLSTWSLTYPIHGRPVVRCRMLSSDARGRRSDTPRLVPNVTGSI